MVNAGGNSNKKLINTRTLQIYKYTLLWHSHCTVKVAEDEVAVSKLLLATHLYCPASDCWTLDMVNWWFPLLEDTLSRTSPVTFNSSPFFVQTTSGVGYPATTQLKSTVCFSSFVRLVGGSEISGPTSNVKIKNEKLSHYKTIRISQNTAKIVVSAIFAETLQHCNTDLNESCSVW